jgi:hypothetical protein
MIQIYRANELFNTPARRGQSGRRGKLNVARTTFYDAIEPRLERVQLSERAVGYTDRSVHRLIEEGIAAASAERAADK